MSELPRLVASVPFIGFTVDAKDEKQGVMLHQDGSVRMKMEARNGRVWKIKVK